MVGNSGRDHDQEPKSDSTGYPSLSLVSTSREVPRQCETHRLLQKTNSAVAVPSRPQTFAPACRSRKASTKDTNFSPPRKRFLKAAEPRTYWSAPRALTEEQVNASGLFANLESAGISFFCWQSNGMTNHPLTRLCRFRWC